MTSLLANVDGDALDRAVCAWLAARRATGGDAEPIELRAVAVDGKTLRDSKMTEGKRVHLLSAVDHAAAITLAQRNVGSKTNETGEFCRHNARNPYRPLPFIGITPLPTQQTFAHALN